ncbi:MAG: hypothetical protein GY853_12950 [PVC group bacterium]|nr:hypothetical protein [PVC group bacterium]
MNDIYLDICGHKLSVCSEDEGFIAELKDKYRNFISKLEGDINILVAHKPFKDEDSDIVVQKEAKGYVITGNEIEARVDDSLGKIKLKIPANAGTFDCFLRIFYSLLLLEDDAFLIHAAGLAKAGRGVLFTGPSESGKTTTVSRAEGLDILSDELVAIKEDDGQFYLFSTPFHGEYRGDVACKCVPLQKIYFLTKKVVEQKPLKILEVFVGLLENTFFFYRNKQADKKILELCHKLSKKVDAYHMNILAERSVGRLFNEV